MSDRTADLLLNEDGYVKEEKRKGTGGQKVHLHYTVTNVDFGDKIDPAEDKGWYMELDCSCNNQHKESKLIQTGEKWSCEVNTNGISDTTFSFKLRAATGPDMGRAIVTVHFVDNI